MDSYKFLILACFMAIVSKGVNAQSRARAQWVFRGQAASSNNTQVFNVADTFIIQCLGSGAGQLQAQAASKLMLFAITVKDFPTKITATVSSGSTAPTLTVDKGTLVFDSINGNALAYSHVYANIFHPVVTAGKNGRGSLIMLIPFLRLSDSNTYYCTFTDGVNDTSAASSNSVGNSAAFIMMVQTKPGQNSSRKTIRNKYLEYTALMVSFSKFIL